jgi:hypothetical protein
VVPDGLVQQPITADGLAMLAQLWSADFPHYDPWEVERRFGSQRSRSRTVNAPPRAVGDRLTFTLPERDIETELVLITENALFWLETTLDHDPEKLAAVGQRLETTLYPAISAIFGQEWRPGVDNDPRFSLVHFEGGTDVTELGFFDSTNQFPRDFDPVSNEQEVVFMNMTSLTFGEDLYYGTLVHELQHMIQWHNDPNETVWLDEGLAQVAELVVGFYTSESADYLENPAIALEGWEYDDDVIYAHYAASYLFATWFWEQLGDEALAALAHDSANGLQSVARVLAQFRPEQTVQQFLADWAVANLLDNPEKYPPYGYRLLRLNRPTPHARVRAVPWELSADLPSFGVHYLDLRATGSYTLTFAGDTWLDLVPTQSPTRQPLWLAPGFDNLNSTLTRRIDLRGTSNPALTFSLWFDLEEDYDFAFVTLSADNGRTWEPVATKQSIETPYGPGYTGLSSDRRGHSKGWLHDQISLARHTGSEVLVRFELLTDSGIPSAGLAVTALTLTEEGAGTRESADWQPDGFLYGSPQIPRQWHVQVVQEGVVTPLPLNSYNQGQLPLTVGAQGATIIIMPQTPSVTTHSTYWLRLAP